MLSPETSDKGPPARSEVAMLSPEDVCEAVDCGQRLLSTVVTGTVRSGNVVSGNLRERTISSADIGIRCRCSRYRIIASPRMVTTLRMSSRWCRVIYWRRSQVACSGIMMSDVAGNVRVVNRGIIGCDINRGVLDSRLRRLSRCYSAPWLVASPRMVTTLRMSSRRCIIINCCEYFNVTGFHRGGEQIADLSFGCNDTGSPLAGGGYPCVPKISENSSTSFGRT